ncbi:hypothetical protein POK33_37840 [Burkholderia cenocepacia]|nr:hypothetical protein [Burkholderia cenocepacia]MDF0506519.1 hypothetical protein [Burkholderia cenocepacia]
MAGDALTPEELEIIGQQRLFDDAIPAPTARVPLEADAGSQQLRLF